MSKSINKPSTGFWIVSIFAIIWNAIGVMAYFAQVNMTDNVKNTLTEVQRTLYENTPSWATAAFAIAVFGGLLGSLLLVVRKKLATIVLMISLLGIIVQMIYNFFLSNTAEIHEPQEMIMPIMVLIIGILLIRFSKNATLKGWLS